jgi:hypothetical protein
MTYWIRGVVTGAVLSALLVTDAAVATAQEPPSGTAPVTVTLSQELVTRLCERRLPKIEARTDRLITRITGDADTRGSAEWLRAKAARERDAGRETSARLLDERAERRAGRVDELKRIQQWAQDFRADHCGPT